jgi:hypothetical protein
MKKNHTKQQYISLSQPAHPKQVKQTNQKTNPKRSSAQQKHSQLLTEQKTKQQNTRQKNTNSTQKVPIYKEQQPPYPSTQSKKL